MSSCKFDVLIIGAGMSGLAAGATAARAGARVYCAEKGDQIGGSARLSAGMFWAPRNLQSLLNHVPNTDVELASAYLDDYMKAVTQIRKLGIKVADRFDGIMTIGIGYPTDVWSLFKLEEKMIKNAGGEIKLNTRAISLIKDNNGRVIGATFSRQDGTQYNIFAKNTIISTGGFQGSSAEVSKRIGNFADSIFLRANPYSVGDGLRFAEGAGAATSRGMSTYYGHLMPSPLRAQDTPPQKFIPLAMYASTNSILVNRSGRRFCDESRGDEVTNQEVALQPTSRALILIDDKTYKEKYISAPFPNAGLVDRIAEAEKIGAHVAHAGTIDQLLEKVEKWGFDSVGIKITIQEYEAASSGIKNVRLDAPLPQSPNPLQQAPFHAVEVQPSITFTYGGIRIDKEAHALDHDGRSIPGLLIAGVDAGGFSNWTYAGGLSLAYCLGVWAGTTATRNGNYSPQASL